MRGVVPVSARDGKRLWVSSAQKEAIRDLIYTHKLGSESEALQHLLDEHKKNNGHSEGTHA